ncbi:MAG: type II toxin-antitoxin system HicB family antitoxin [Chloroflexota bacterium]
MKRAKFEWLDSDQAWHGEIPDLPGVWATGGDGGACRSDLRSVLGGRLLLSIHDHDELPVIDGVDPSVRQVA